MDNSNVISNGLAAATAVTTAIMVATFCLTAYTLIFG